MYERIIEQLRTGQGFSFMYDQALMNQLTADFKHDTTRRVNNYHSALKKFHFIKYGIELKDGDEFGRPGDRISLQIGIEYLFFCVNNQTMREFEINWALKTITVF